MVPGAWRRWFTVCILSGLGIALLGWGVAAWHAPVPVVAAGGPERAQGAPLRWSATSAVSISNIIGATYDDERGEILIFGIADPRQPGMDWDYLRENLLVALRAYYNLQPDVPGVSIEGVEDPLQVLYFGGITNIHFGQVAFETDRLLKIYTMGVDNLTGLTVTSGVTGYLSYPDRMRGQAETVTAPIMIRYFFTPTLWAEPITTPPTLLFSQTQALIDWAYLSVATSTATANAAQGFVDNFNQYYFDYAHERWLTQGDTTLYEMAQLAKLTAIAQWAADHQWDLHLPGLNEPWLNHLSLAVTPTTTQTRGITVTWQQTITGVPYQLEMRGGVYAVGQLVALAATAFGQQLADQIQSDCQPPAVDRVCIIRAVLQRPFSTHQRTAAPYALSEGPLVAYAIPVAANAVGNGDFESGPGSPPWHQSSLWGGEVIRPESPLHGNYGALFPVYNNDRVALSQTVAIPADATAARLTYWRAVATEETTHPYDFFAAFLTTPAGARLTTLETLDDGDSDPYWRQVSFDMLAYAGQPVQLWFTATTDGSYITNFFLDDISLDYLDLTPPTVISVTGPSAVGQGEPARFTLQFREWMKNTVTPTVVLKPVGETASYTLTPQAGPDWHQGYRGDLPVVWQGSYTLTAPLADGPYQLHVAAAQDLAGNVMIPAPAVFTVTYDGSAPQLLSGFPPAGMDAVDLQAALVLTFSEAISTSTLSYAVTPDPGGWNATWDSQHRQVTLTHLPWTPATRYTVTLSQARDLVGNPLAGAPVSWAFTTLVVDEIAPQVQAVFPPAEASAVPLDAGLVITFSEAISIPTLAYAVTPDPGGWNATWDSQHRQVTLTHLPWTPATRYTVTLSQARDLAGNPLAGAPVSWSFTTLVVDEIAPQVQAVFPPAEASAVPLDAGLVITFSEAISTSTLSYAVTPDPGGWNATWDSQHRQVTLTHLPWTPATRYTVTLSQARDLAGNPLAGAPVSWSFTTTAVDLLPPQVLGVFPPAGARGVPLTASLVLTFNEAISTTTLAYTVIPDPGGWSAQWSPNRHVATLSHYAFAPGTWYTVTVSQARDLAGNDLVAGPVRWSYQAVQQLYLPLTLRTWAQP